MTTAPSYMTPEVYLKEERQQDTRHEYENGKIIPMGGASKEHNRIVRNILTTLWAFLKSTNNHEVYANDLRVLCPDTSKYYYPDVLITVGEEKYLDDKFDTLLNPFIIIEVLSDSTKDRDRTTKFEAYRSIDSFSEYLLVAQDKYCVEGFYKNEAGDWVIKEPVHGLEAQFTFQHLDLSLDMKDIYNKVLIQEKEEDTTKD